MKISSVDDIIKENKRRREEMFGRFNPITGEGSVGERVRIEIEDFPIRIQWIPRKMLEVPLVKKLVKTGSVSSFIENVLGVVVDEDTKEKVVEQFTRIRCRFDFPFWAATFVYIKDKDPGKPDCLFRLTYPQRKYLSVLEEDRLAGKPIRICMCKARQWGGSTETQMYMAWLQLCHRPSLNSIIVAHVNPASEKIKAMFRKMLDAYPLEMMHEPGESFQQGEKKLVWDGNSDTTQRIPQRNCTISVGSSESPNSARSGDYALAHISEIGLFKDTEKIKPADLIRSATSGILYRPYTMIVYESTADGVGTYFHKEYTAAADGKSQFKPFFMPWYGIELYQLDFDDEAYKLEFAKWLLKNMDNSNIPSDREESGRYLWYLWQQGATLEAINWYIKERTKYFEHGKMAAEFPTDAIEAFVNNGANVFDKYRVEPLRITCRAPHYIGDIYADCDDGEGALQGLRFNEDSQGQLWV
ncbi:MAG: terminase, partial [Bacteroidaceae bacterium]|nr:terminase [Bacteroidaceae bacterium]